MAIILWIFQFFSPIIMFIGGLFLLETGFEQSLLISGCACSCVGLVIGIIGWIYTVPPRWFWIKSSMALSGSRILTAIGYAIQFFFIPAFVMGIIDVL